MYGHLAGRSSPRKTGFSPRVIYVGFMMNKVAMTQVFLNLLKPSGNFTYRQV
jgi:hypothetical protein